MRIAVTGASGRIGGQVVRLLAAGQPHQVVALSRRGLLPGRWPPSVSARAADYADPQALGAVLRNVDTLVFVSSDGPVAEVMVHHQNVIRAAGARASAARHRATSLRETSDIRPSAAGSRTWPLARAVARNPRKNSL